MALPDRDDLVAQLVDVGNIGLVLALLPEHQGGLHRQASRTSAGLQQNVDHARDERVHRVRVVRVEAVAERGQSDRVQRQAREVVDDIDVALGAESLQLEHELLADVDHVAEHASDADRAKHRHENVVGDAPIGLLGEGSKQAIAGEVPYMLKRCNEIQ
ncbi:hypothetical protein PBRA_005129 [Plasmodiophora brassicae]|uniref:Uncharacterized protein n=1 Tax=Plasmodiophora brassicae TaxID=37360 RepID=A0A0G4IMQ7_PLABS|nr:hypothetical protein PBRA_005129 [Plasmodiophora brassicae]